MNVVSRPQGPADPPSGPDDPPEFDSWAPYREGRPSTRCGFRQVHRKKGDKNAHRAIRALCGRWSCGVCGVFVKKFWTEHITRCIERDRTLVYVAFIWRSEWQQLRDQIKKHKEHQGRYAWIDLTGTSIAQGWEIAVFTTAPISEDAAPAEHIFETVRAFVVAAPFDRKRVFTGRKWKQPDKKTREWERVGKLGGDMHDTEAVLRALGIPIGKTRRLGGQSDLEPVVIDFEVSAEWMTDSRYADVLSWLELGQLDEDLDETTG